MPSVFSDNPRHSVPKGHFEKSPALKRREGLKERRVPQGRLRQNAFFGRPCGTYGNSRHIPALKRRAIVGGSSGTGRLLKIEMRPVPLSRNLYAGQSFTLGIRLNHEIRRAANKAGYYLLGIIRVMSKKTILFFVAVCTILGVTGWHIYFSSTDLASLVQNGRASIRSAHYAGEK